MKRRLAGIIRKEFIHIFRDWRTLLIIILMPIMMIVLYGYAITLDMKNIRFAVDDASNTENSRALIDAFSENSFFVLRPVHAGNVPISDLFQRREVEMVLVVPEDFSETLIRDGSATVQLIVDASDANVGSYVQNYSKQVVALFNRRFSSGSGVLFSFEPRIWYNPQMKSSYFFVPGLVALILILISSLLTSIAVTREKESGTLEQILVSPVNPFEIVLGKVCPYIALGLLNLSMILISARLLFSVPIEGSLLLIGLLSLVYIFVALSFGLLISTVAKTQQLAMLMTLMATILPTIMLSGFIFPIASMPIVLQNVSRVIPATYFLVIIRGIMLKGNGLAELWSHAAILTGIGALLIAVATRRFKMTLE